VVVVVVVVVSCFFTFLTPRLVGLEVGGGRVGAGVFRDTIGDAVKSSVEVIPDVVGLDPLLDAVDAAL